MTQPKFGHHFSNGGFVAELGRGSFNHVFGGSSWTATGPLEGLGHPTLLLCLDLADPLLDFEFDSNLVQLPLFSYINHDGLISQQSYTLLPDTSAARFMKTSEEFVHPLDSPSRLATPLTAKPLMLRSMTASELPTDEDSYWTACDSFVGGNAFLRISGPPVWVQDVKEPICMCGHKPRYLASIGYENAGGAKGYVSDSEPFYLGEFALYFFGCQRCSQIEVISQSV